MNTIILKSPEIIEPWHGFGPLINSLNICMWIYMIWAMYKMIKETAGQFIDQISEKYNSNKIQNKKSTTEKSKINFKDVAGAEEEKEELQEIVDFLKNPQKYFDMGARMPKGILLSGPPGTGKTLLAKALSGEANVPFFAVSGSEFVEMFIGLGASRIRNLFQMAQKNAPCIIFIDEIETLARKRGMFQSNSEQEQTLNQLLIELDGYNQNTGVIVIAATNKPNLLDSAILRPGRFDRQFIVSLPSVKDREAILKLHAANKKISPEVDLEELAKQTPGFSGAQLEGILNEAALLATRQNIPLINKKIISEALDRILIGPAKKSRKYSQKEKKLVAYHEAGHAVIGLTLPEAKKVQKITIIPRGNAGGYNLMLHENETFFLSKKQLLADIIVCLGGRAAEELFLDDISNGAYEDFRQATKIAQTMVTKFGMSVLGLTQFGKDEENFQKNFSDHKALEIDQAIQDIISNCYEQAKKIILENKETLVRISEYLLEVETLSKKDIEEIYQTGNISWYEKEKKELESKKEVQNETKNIAQSQNIDQENNNNNEEHSLNIQNNSTKNNSLKNKEIEKKQTKTMNQIK
ncbi:MAG: ATP-dependent zinc metalloprotease FtsH [Vigna little leaf phytoplasma]|nr:ATP-dependent zinc metalloprotease FtsH [Vigna little leaf phytoplasma]